MNFIFLLGFCSSIATFLELLQPRGLKESSLRKKSHLQIWRLESDSGKGSELREESAREKKRNGKDMMLEHLHRTTEVVFSVVSQNACSLIG